MPDVLTPEDVIAQVDALPPRPPADVLDQLGTVDRRAVEQAAGRRAAIRQAVVKIPGLSGRIVDDHRCEQWWTVMSYIGHTTQVQHEPGEVTPHIEVDERDAGRQGESRTAANS